MKPATGLPFESIDGVKLARRCKMLQVVMSRTDEPLDRSTSQLVTLP
jgi:hypothetical protein